MEPSKVKTIGEYIAGFPAPVRKLLRVMYKAVKEAAPSATEDIKYGIPTLVLNGNLVHFAAFKAHIGFYPTPRGIVQFSKELAGYEQSKGAVRFPFDRPLPVTLIKRMVRFRVKQNTVSHKAKAS